MEHIDWTDIERRIRTGESARSLAKEYGISHTAILKRAKKGGWRGGARTSTKAPVVTETEPTGLALGARSPENRKLVLGDLKYGIPLGLAARAVGMSEDSLEAWMRAEPVFAQQASAAKARGHADLVKAVVDAAKRGDWRAAMALLERLKETRDEFAAPKKDSGTVHVTFNFDRGDPDPFAEGAIDIR